MINRSSNCFLLDIERSLRAAAAAALASASAMAAAVPFQRTKSALHATQRAHVFSLF